MSLLTIKKENAKQKVSVRILITEFFYFLSALLFLGFIVELILPGLFLLYFNGAFLVLLWLVGLFSLVLNNN